MMMPICSSNTYATFEAQFMKKLSNTEAELKKALLIQKSVYPRNAYNNTRIKGSFKSLSNI